MRTKNTSQAKPLIATPVAKSSFKTTRLFPLIVPERREDNESIKWKQGEESYSIHMPLLRSIDLRDLLPHVLNFHDKIRTPVFSEDSQGQALFAQFPRVLSPVVRSTWDTVLADEGDDLPPLNERTVEQFNDMLQYFIAAHCTPEDQQELISMIRALRKPWAMAGQAFWYRLRELNSYINCLPGNAAPLSDGEIREIIYGAMPEAWRDRFITSGQSKTIPIAEMVRYFRAQEQASNQRALDNQSTQKQNAAHLRSTKDNNKSSSQEKKRPSALKRKINDDDECPIHGGHKWKDCMSNAHGSNPKGAKRGRSSTTSTTTATAQTSVSQVNLPQEAFALSDDVPINDTLMSEQG